MTSSLQTLVPLLQTRWRQGRRMFDSRLLNERRLIIVALVALSWFLFDSTLVTPSFKQFHAAVERNKAAKLARDTLQNISSPPGSRAAIGRMRPPGKPGRRPLD